MDKKNDNNVDFVLLAGAGASCAMGYPLLDDVLSQAIIVDENISELIYKVRKSIKVEKIKTAAFEEVIAKIKECINAVCLLRTYPVLRDEASQMPQDIINGDLETKFQEALTNCYRILVQQYGPDVINKNSSEFLFLEQLFEVLSKEKKMLHIYTTNYDCSFQVLSSNCNNISFFSHIHNEKGTFSESWYNSRKKIGDTNLPQIYIHRLHGCVTWFNVKDNAGGSGDTIEKYGSGGGGEKLKIEDDELHTMCIKLVASQLLGTNRVFASAFEEFSHHLKKIKLLLVWGYSFRDLEVTRQINDALSSRKDDPFKIYYIDPFLDNTDAKENIRKTLKNAPIEMSENFIPIQIKWTIYDGRDDLIRKVTKIITEEIK